MELQSAQAPGAAHNLVSRLLVLLLSFVGLLSFGPVLSLTNCLDALEDCESTDAAERLDDADSADRLEVLLLADVVLIAVEGRLSAPVAWTGYVNVPF
jgi:hypothetical protein